MKRSFVLFSFVAVFVVVGACASNESGPTTGAGGTANAGTAGTGQAGGSSGLAGTTGSGGVAGTTGVSGAGGAGGSSGTGGTTGAGASGGATAGTTGTAGRGGTTGAGGGAAGRGGTTGAAGRGGTGGATAGRGGTGVAGTTGTGGARAACSAPAAYRNLFSEILAKTQTEVDTKINTAFMQLFHGTGSQPIYYELGSDQAFIQDIANNDVRSEGVSYGMFITVALDKKTEFDKLWRFAATRMRQSNGLFAWQLNTSGGIISSGDAPDGDEYFAMALLLASRRWGDSTGTFNYGDDARSAMNALATQGPFNQNPAIVRFGLNSNFTDASYVLPLFYSEWACFDTAHASFWQSATTYARTFFQTATNSSTGLAPDHSGYDGSPMGNFGSDAWRVPINIMMDANLNNADPWQLQTYAPRMAAFWKSQGTNYGNAYTPSGSQTSAGHGAGLTGANAMLAFGLSSTDAKPFLQALWDAAIPTGTYRYYDGCLYLLSLLHLGGKMTLGT